MKDHRRTFSFRKTAESLFFFPAAWAKKTWAGRPVRGARCRTSGPAYLGLGRVGLTGGPADEPAPVKAGPRRRVVVRRSRRCAADAAVHDEDGSCRRPVRLGVRAKGGDAVSRRHCGGGGISEAEVATWSGREEARRDGEDAGGGVRRLPSRSCGGSGGAGPTAL